MTPLGSQAALMAAVDASNEPTPREELERQAHAKLVEWRRGFNLPDEPTEELVCEAHELFGKRSLGELENERVLWFKRYWPDLIVYYRNAPYEVGNLSPLAWSLPAYGTQAVSKASGIPQRYASATLEAFKCPLKEHSQLRTVIEKFLGEWDGGKRTSLGLLLFGSVGSGKTFAMSCIARHFAEKRIKHVWVDAAEWVADLKEAIDDSEKSKSAIFHGVADAPVLFLDDLGKERLTEFALESVQRALDLRYRNVLPTFISTNLSLGSKPYKDHRCEFGQGVGERVFSRLCGMLAFVGPFPKYDWRRGGGEFF